MAKRSAESGAKRGRGRDKVILAEREVRKRKGISIREERVTTKSEQQHRNREG